MSKTLQELASHVGGNAVGNLSMPIFGITNIETPKEGFITFVQENKYLKKLETTNIAALIVPKTVTQSPKALIQVDHPKLAWAKLLYLFFPAQVYQPGISSQASISKTATIGKNVTIEPFVTICDNADIGDETIIRSHAFIGENVKIGRQSFIHPNVVIYFGCIIGNHTIIHAGTVIGADGFGYVATPKGHEKVPQVGNVIIEDHVEIGASVTIDRATIGSTHISSGCKIDNLVQIAHNVFIGNHTVISAQTGISGSSKIGNFVTMGGKVGVGDHVEIGDFVMVGAGSGLPTGKKIPPKQIVFGEPARPYQEARRQIGAQLKSAEMYDELKRLKKKVASLEAQISKEGIPSKD